MNQRNRVALFNRTYVDLLEQQSYGPLCHRCMHMPSFDNCPTSTYTFSLLESLCGRLQMLSHALSSGCFEPLFWFASPPIFGIAFHVLHVSALFEQDSGLKIGSGFSVSTFEQDLSSL